MANTSSTKKSVPLSLIGKTFHFIFTLLLLAMLAWMLLLLVAGVGIFLSNWQPIWEIFQKAIFDMTSHLWVNQLGLEHIMQQADTALQLPNWLAWAFPVNAQPVAKLAQGSENLWITFLLVTQFVIERCQVFIMGFIVIFAFMMLGFVDGLVQRDIRKFKNTRESTLFFHRSKGLLSIVFFAGYFFFIVTPMDINLTAYLMLMALLTGYLVQVSTRQFKKYL